MNRWLHFAIEPPVSFPRVSVLFTLLCIFCCAAAFSTTVSAQVQYTPDHPEVLKMVEKAVGFLESNPVSGLGDNVLVALAIVEAGKRTNQEIPTENPIVKSAIDGILKELPGGDRDVEGLLEAQEMYVPSLATILLAEVNAVKYRPQIQQLIKSFETRQQKNGGFTYKHEVNIGDMSQTQFVSLAMFVAKHNGIKIDPVMAGKTLQFTVLSQRQQGYWIYKVQGANPNGPFVPQNSDVPNSSMLAAGLGTAYLLADVLQLTTKKKDMDRLVASEGLVGLPRSVSVYVKPLEGAGVGANKEGPLVNFNMAQLQNSFRAGNAFIEKNFEISPADWTFYYLYALERYAWFREQAEGDMGGGRLMTWYDKGVNFIKSCQKADGSLVYEQGNKQESALRGTALGILFLVRSSEILTLPSSDSELLGGEGFPDEALNIKDGQLVGSGAEKDLSEMLKMLDEDASPEQLEVISSAMKKAVQEFKNKDNKSRAEIKVFLRTMVAANNYFRRKIAIRFLASEQDMDNVPALIYALGDTDFRVCIEAHDGLRLISRRIDSLTVTDATRKNAIRDPGVLTDAEKNAMRLDFNDLKKKWAQWFLGIRPDARLLD